MNAEQVRGILQQVEQRGPRPRRSMQKGIQVVKKMLEDRLKQLEGGVK